uniref:FLYWCH-type domain-containing protein n=1 Tax=Meloidogyne javanica TaxID=6303 RepID=A0A915N1Y6_MELJA
MDSIIQSRKSKNKLIHEGFPFIFDKLIRDDTVKSWRCEAKKVCKARLWSDLQDNVLLEKTGVVNHSHDANPAKVISQISLTSLKRRAQFTMEAPAVLQANVMENVPSPALYALPTKNAMKKVIKRTRAEIQAGPANVNNLDDLCLPERYKNYSRTENEEPENFLIADSGIFHIENDERTHS